MVVHRYGSSAGRTGSWDDRWVERNARPRAPTGLRRLLFRLPIPLYRAHLGWLLGHRFVLINHVGRRTGRPRRVVVEVVAREPVTGTVTVASGFGPGADWYRNLLARPDVSIQVGARRARVRAVPLTAEQGGAVMVTYARRHGRAARVLSRYLGFVVNGGADDYRAVGQKVPFVRFEPRE